MAGNFRSRPKLLDGRPRSPAAKLRSSSAASPATTPRTPRSSSSITASCSGLATHLLGDREEALDLSQEVFLRVFRTLHRFRGQSSLRTWIFRIVVNQVRNRQRWWRRRQRSNQVSLDEHIRDHGEMVLGADASTPDRELTRKEIGARLKTAIQNLPFEQRTALVLREVEGLKYEEIAFSLGLPVGTVKSRLTRARQALRVELGDLRC